MRAQQSALSFDASFSSYAVTPASAGCRERFLHLFTARRRQRCPEASGHFAQADWRALWDGTVNLSSLTLSWWCARTRRQRSDIRAVHEINASHFAPSASMCL